MYSFFNVQSPRTTVARLAGGLLGLMAVTSGFGQTNTVPSYPGETLRPQVPEVPVTPARDRLAQMGIYTFFSYTGTGLWTPEGGREPGATYNGVFVNALDADLEKAFGLDGWKFDSVALFFHGRIQSRDKVGDYLFTNNDGLDAGLRLWEINLTKTVGDLSVRFGQFAPVSEFMSGDYAGIFTNSNFSLFGPFVSNVDGAFRINLLSFSIPSPGVRVLYKPSTGWYAGAGIWDGNPDPTFGDPGTGAQNLNRSGTRWSFNNGAFLMSEIGYRPPPAAGSTVKPSVYKVGALYNTEEQTDWTGRQVKGDWGLYAAMNQVLMAEYNKDKTTHQALGLSLRAAVLPKDRNFYDYYFDGGLGYIGLFPNRPLDVLALGFSYAHVSSDAVKRLRSFGTPASSPYEGAYELTYRWNVRPTLTVQPTIKFSDNPHAPNAYGDAFTYGLRTTIIF